MDEYNQGNNNQENGQRNPSEMNYTQVPQNYTNNYQQPKPPIINQYNTYQNNPQSSEGQGFGIASLVLGIFGFFVVCCIPIIGAIPSILAIIFGALGMKYPAGKGMAIAGLILGCIGLVPALIMLFILAYPV